MSELPPVGTSAKEFFEGFVPRAFAANPVPDDAKQLDVTLGVRLEGDGGGEWRFHLKNGELRVEPGPTDDAAFTVLQKVDDWRGALWEGRGGAFGRQSQALFRPAAAGAPARPGAAPGPGAMSPAALALMQQLRGVIKMVVTGGTGGDWSVAFKLGPGAIPPEPTTTVTVSAADADAMERGELDPMQAFMAGRIQVAGDMALLMQMQAIQMQAAAMAQSKASS
jgi:hypothetical protein